MLIFFLKLRDILNFTPSQESRPFVTLGLVSLSQLRLYKIEKKTSGTCWVRPPPASARTVSTLSRRPPWEMLKTSIMEGIRDFFL